MAKTWVFRLASLSNFGLVRAGRVNTKNRTRPLAIDNAIAAFFIFDQTSGALTGEHGTALQQLRGNQRSETRLYGRPLSPYRQRGRAEEALIYGAHRFRQIARRHAIPPKRI